MKTIIRFLLVPVGIAFALWCAALGFLYVNQDGMIFPVPPVKPAPSAASGFLPLELVTSDGETLNLLQHEAKVGEAWVIAFHGNGGDVVQILPEAMVFADAGFGVLLAEYRGYNGSTGSPSMDGLYTDALAAFDHLRERTDAPIHLYGHSLGAAMAIHVAENREAARVALLSPFDTLLNVAQARYPVLPLRPFLRHPFPSDEKIGFIEEEMIIFHGDRDGVVPVSHGRALHDAAPPQTLFRLVEGAGHNDLFQRGITAEAARFFEEAAPR